MSVLPNFLIEPQFILAIAAFFTALAAVFVSVWQGSLMRKHNRLSVRPHIDIGSDSYPGEPITFVLENTGVGPAFIQAIQLSRNGVDFRGSTKEQITQMVETFGTACNYRFRIPIAGHSAMKTGELMKIVSFDSTTTDEILHDIVKRAMQEITISVVYNSIYQEQFTSSRCLKL